LRVNAGERYGTGVDLPLRRRHSKGALKPGQVHCNEYKVFQYLRDSHDYSRTDAFL
jgi:hypothetical protein